MRHNTFSLFHLLRRVFSWFFRDNIRGKSVAELQLKVLLGKLALATRLHRFLPNAWNTPPKNSDLYHLESRWRNSHVLVCHGALLIQLLGVEPSTFTTVYYDWTNDTEETPSTNSTWNRLCNVMCKDMAIKDLLNHVTNNYGISRRLITHKNRFPSVSSGLTHNKWKVPWYPPFLSSLSLTSAVRPSGKNHDGSWCVMSLSPRSTSLKTNMALENPHVYLIGNTSSNGCFSIVMLVFGGGGVVPAISSIPQHLWKQKHMIL